MNVVPITRCQDLDVVEAAREVLRMAEAGEVHGFAFLLAFGPNEHRAGTAGEYRRSHSSCIQSCAAFLLANNYTRPGKSSAAG